MQVLELVLELESSSSRPPDIMTQCFSNSMGAQYVSLRIKIGCQNIASFWLSTFLHGFAEALL
jgi:hypothetical protein